MNYAFDKQLGKWVVIAGGDVVIRQYATEQEAIDYIKGVFKQ